MEVSKNVDPQTLKGTDADEPKFEKTERWLVEQNKTGQWSSVPPVIALQVGGEHWVVDGNHRRNFAEEHGLAIPEVQTIESNEDMSRLGKISPIYSKVKTVSQLRSILEPRLK